MSNLQDLLNDISKGNTTPTKTLGDAIGTLADIGGTIGLVSTAISIVENWIGIGDTTQQQLSTILSTIQNDYAALNQAAAAANKINQLQNIAQILGEPSGPQAALGSLKSLVQAQPPPSQVEVSTIIGNSASGIDILSDSNYWQVVQSYQVYWTDAGLYVYPDLFGFPIDAGYGEQAPPSNPSDNVFNYIYALPAYMQAIFIFLAVGKALSPTFVSDFVATIRRAATTLQTQHDAIVGGITTLTPPYWDGSTIQGSLAEISLNIFGGKGITPLPAGVSSGANIEYGAVEIFSGASSMTNYVLPFTEFPLGSTNPAPYNKFQIRALREAKHLYDAVGLRTVWKTISTLNNMLGNPPSQRPNYGDWSFRTLINIAQIPAINGSFSLMALARFIKYTAPLDTPTNQLWTSFQTLLLPP